MVIGHDFPQAKDLSNKNKDTEKQLFIAHPTDRMAAFIVDLMILIPIIKIICGKIILTMKVTYIFHLPIGFVSSLFVLFWTGFCAYVLYQVMAYIFFGKTVGQYFFKIALKNTDYKNQKVQNYIIILRSLLSVLSVFTFIPLISVFTDRKGQTFYDKICGTMMVSTKSVGVTSQNTLMFHQLVGSFFVLQLLIIVTLASAYLSKNFYNFEVDLNSGTKICKDVSDYHKKWANIGSHESRLEVALALYSTARISPECLKKEIAFEFSIDNANALGYFAKGMLELSNTNLASEYFKKACEFKKGHTDPCEVSIWLSTWPEKYEGEIKNKIRLLPTYAQIWSLKRDLEKGNMLKFAIDLDAFEVKSGLENFYAEMQFKLDRYKQENSSNDMLKALSGYNLEEDKFNEKICSLDLVDGCKGLYSVNCQKVNFKTTGNSFLLNSMYACRNQKHNIISDDLNLKKFYKNFKDEDLVDADVLKSIYKNVNHPVEIRLAALNKNFQMVKNPTYLNKMFDDWSLAVHRDYVWRVWGETLIEKFKEIGDPKNGFQIYKSLAKEYGEQQPDTEEAQSLRTQFLTDLGFFKREPASQKAGKGKTP